MTMPIWRCSRTACWAAATERGRPTVTGATMPGNSTILRTGTMISASAGSGGVTRACSSAMACLHFQQSDHQTAIRRRAPDVAIAAGRQPYAALEPSLRQLDAMDDGGAQLGRQRPG